MALMMALVHKLNNLFRPARITRGRMVFAVLVAVVADGLQILLPIPPAPEIVDVVAMVLTSVGLGFHLLLLPTFAVEFIPVVDMLPTWVGCVVAVIAMRKREERSQPSATPIQAEVLRIPPKIDSSPKADSNLPKT